MRPKTRKATGRPTKRTPQLVAKILKDIRDGNYPDTAAMAHGVGRRTFYEWLDAEPFRTDVARARAFAERSLLKAVASGDKVGVSNGRAKGAAWILERTRPGKFSARVNLKVESELAEFLDVAERELDRDVYVKLLAAFDAHQERDRDEGLAPGEARAELDH